MSSVDTVLMRDFDPQAKTEEEIQFVGFRGNGLKQCVYWILVVCTLGLFWLLARWIPKLYIALNCTPSSLHNATRICAKGHLKELTKVQKETNPTLIEANSPKYFIWRYQVWRWYEDVDELPYCSRYRPVRYPFEKPISELSKSADAEARALHYRTLALKKQIFGDNLISVPVANPFQLLIDEVLHPFYLFQLFSVTLWYVEIYATYATAILIISAIGALIGMFQTRKNLKNIKRLAEFECPVKLITEHTSHLVSSKELVPGDIVQIAEGLIMPCDMVLLRGQCVVNESMLTGESVPVIKAGTVPDDHDIYNPNASKHSKYTLYGGTQVLQIRQTNSPEVLAKVIQTGFSTTKGALVRSILYPKPLKMKFYRDSFFFIAFLFLLALAGFCVMLFRFIELEVETRDIIIRCLDLFTIAIPPALPIALTIGVVFAVDRLKHKRISCIAPTRVNLAGLVSLFCFDKTGTLTEDGLDVMGVRPVSPYGTEFMPEVKDLEQCPSQELLKVLTSCHNLALLGDTFIGDSLEVKMFEATHWKLEEIGHESHLAQEGVSAVVSPPVPHARLQYGIMKHFDFSSEHQRMSTICKNMESGEFFICSKGAPEVIGQMANPSSLPPDFQEVLSSYTKCGFRVLGCAMRRLNLSEKEALSLTRDEAEEDMNFVGLLILQNKLKPETLPALTLLNNAEIGSIMVTGDNALTACYVGIGCNLISKDKPIYLGEYEEGKGVLWQNIDNPKEPKRELYLLLEGSYRNFSSDNSTPSTELLDLAGSVELAVTGAAFEHILKEPLELRTVLRYAHVYARMKPDQKQRLVEELAASGYTVGMCGDGANDCGALKAADVGISLSEAEASIAAPFTSAIPNISCVVDLLCEGRCALVTSFQAFKYMASYSLIQYTTIMILYSFAALLSDWEFLWIDLFIVMPLAFACAYTGAYPKLSKQKPITSLMSWNVITSLMSQILTNSLFQLGVYFLVRYQDAAWAVNTCGPTDHGIESKCPQATCLFLVSNFQYTFSVFAFSVGKPFRKSFLSNKLYVCTLTVLTVLNSILMFIPGLDYSFALWITKLFNMSPIPKEFLLILFGIAIVNVIVIIAVEEIHHFLFTTKDICRDQQKTSKGSAVIGQKN